jgi:hypothetical protein
MALLLLTDGDSEEAYPQHGQAFTLEELRHFIKGYIEVVRIDENHFLIVDEEGRLKNLPINKQATEIFRKTRDPDGIIVGNAVLCDDTEIE